MALKQLIKNNAVTLLGTPIGPNSTLLTVMAGTGQMFPVPNQGEFFTLTLENESGTIREIVHVTNRTGDALTVIRGQEDTTPLSWSVGEDSETLVDHRITAGTLRRLANDYQNNLVPSVTSFSDALDYMFLHGTTNQRYDAQVQITMGDSETILTTPEPYKPHTVAIFVGGLRQKRGIDFKETGPNEIRLTFTLMQEEMDEGQNLVVDYIGA
jgi:hypothetical protein